MRLRDGLDRYAVGERPYFRALEALPLPAPRRVASVDALRGFTMFWIIAIPRAAKRAPTRRFKDKAPTDESRDGRSGGHMRVTLLKFAAPLEQFSRARVGFATHRTASWRTTDVALACFNFYRSASRI